MSQITKHASRHLNLDEFEALALDVPQVDCQTEHTFGEGWYVRQITIPAGTCVLGLEHRFEVLNNVVSGHARFRNGGDVQDVFGPCTFTAKPGRKLIYAVTETVWQNVIATDIKDPDAIEAIMVKRSPAFLERKAKWRLSQ